MRQVEHRRRMDDCGYRIDWRCDVTTVQFDNVCCASAMLCASWVGMTLKCQKNNFKALLIIEWLSEQNVRHMIMVKVKNSIQSSFAFIDRLLLRRCLVDTNAGSYKQSACYIALKRCSQSFKFVSFPSPPMKIDSYPTEY